MHLKIDKIHIWIAKPSFLIFLWLLPVEETKMRSAIKTSDVALSRVSKTSVPDYSAIIDLEALTCNY